jgi:hypothetical protein
LDPQKWGFLGFLTRKKLLFRRFLRGLGRSVGLEKSGFLAQKSAVYVESVGNRGFSKNGHFWSFLVKNPVFWSFLGVSGKRVLFWVDFGRFLVIFGPFWGQNPVFRLLLAFLRFFCGVYNGIFAFF